MGTREIGIYLLALSKETLDNRSQASRLKPGPFPDGEEHSG